jgi:hypothetical protein
MLHMQLKFTIFPIRVLLWCLAIQSTHYFTKWHNCYGTKVQNICYASVKYFCFKYVLIENLQTLLMHMPVYTLGYMSYIMVLGHSVNPLFYQMA